jgi:NADH-quinone oxidoreductase subunit M
MIAGLEVSYLYAFLASMTLVLAASYSLWLGKRVLFGLPSNDIINNMPPMKNEEFWPLIILILFIILLGVKPGIILDISLVSSEYMIDVINGDIK